MSVDFPVAYPASAAAFPPNKTEDVLSLQQAFSAALRSRYSGKNNTESGTLLDTITAIPPEPAPLQEKQIHDNRQQSKQQQIDRSYQTQVDRKDQNKAEIRIRDMEAGYEKHTERKGRNESGKTENTGETMPKFPADGKPAWKEHAEQSLAAHGKPSAETLSSQTQSSRSCAGYLETTSGGIGITGNNTAADQSLSAGQNTGQNFSASHAASRMNPSQSAEQRVFSVFTLSGKWGQTHEKEEKEDEKEEADELRETKRHPFADLTAILFGKRGIEPPKNGGRVGGRILSSRTSPTKPERNDSPKTEQAAVSNPQQWENLLTDTGNTAAAAKNQPEETERQQYLQRIAAACEHAARNAPIRMKINLDQLGTLSLRFFTKANRLMMQFAPENEETAEFLRVNLPELQSMLAERNVLTEIAFEEKE